MERVFYWHIKVSRLHSSRWKRFCNSGQFFAYWASRETAHWPKPVKLAICGLPLALSAMLIEATRDPVTEGVKVTLMMQVPPAETEAPQVLVLAKSLAFAP